MSCVEETLSVRPLSYTRASVYGLLTSYFFDRFRCYIGNDRASILYPPGARSYLVAICSRPTAALHSHCGYLHRPNTYANASVRTSGQ